MIPYQRTPPDVVAALLHDSSRPKPAARPQSVRRESRATLEDKGNAMSCLAQWVARVRAHQEPLPASQIDAVITVFEAEEEDPPWTVTQQQAVQRTVSYERRNRLYWRYGEYLARGWPIGTGVVTGARGTL
jgi:hypothetical protein